MAKSKRTHSAPYLGDPKAQERLQAAANAAGVSSLEELGNLVVDSGLTSLPPSDGITERYTIEDLGLKLWGTMQDMAPSKRSEWFGGLVDTQQTAVIVVLRDRGFSTEVIARELSVPPLEVNRTWSKHADELGAQVVGLRLNTIAGQMQLAAERAQQMATQKDDPRTYWSIEKDRINLLQSLGIVDKAIHKVEVSHKFDEQQRAEIEALASLKQKQLSQQEDMKFIEAEVVDTVDDAHIPDPEDYDA